LITSIVFYLFFHQVSFNEKKSLSLLRIFILTSLATFSSVALIYYTVELVFKKDKSNYVRKK